MRLRAPSLAVLAAALVLFAACAPSPPRRADLDTGARDRPAGARSIPAVDQAGSESVRGGGRSAAAPPLAVRYLANEGFLVEAGERRVLVDALIGEITGYAPLPNDLREDLESGVGEWAGVDVALATHHHRDHFDPGSVARFLAANPEALFVSTPQAVARLSEFATRSDPAETGWLERLRAVLPAPGAVERLDLEGLEITVLNLHHGRREPPVENLGFVVGLGGARFLHFGDTEAGMEDFEAYLPLLRETDLALLPFWFLSSEWRADLVRDRIRPRWIVAGHLPTPDAPPGHFGRWGSYGNLVEVIRAAFPEAWLPQRPGERLGSPIAAGLDVPPAR